MSASPNPDLKPLAPIRVDADFEDEFPERERLCIRLRDRIRADLLPVARRNRPLPAHGNRPVSGGQVLAIVEGAGEPLPPRVIAARLLVTSGTMTAVLDTLERRGYIVPDTAPH